MTTLSKRAILLCVAAVVTGTWAAGQEPKAAPAPDNGGPPAKVDFIRRSYYSAHVIDKDKESITVKSTGWKLYESTSERGKTREIIIPPQPAKRFQLSKALAAGEPPGIPGDGHAQVPAIGAHACYYPVADIKVGDRLRLEFSRVNGVDICDAITIERRPGGRVPPSPWRRPTDKQAWDDVANAYQDLEEHGIPLPRWLDPEPKLKLMQ